MNNRVKKQYFQAVNGKTGLRDNALGRADGSGTERARGTFEEKSKNRFFILLKYNVLFLQPKWMAEAGREKNKRKKEQAGEKNINFLQHPAPDAAAETKKLNRA